ncbi:MAG: class I SAM-dependent methyltransferase [Bacteroidetes bacterium]|nr:class I SAM-dependent methyltransferase [Bacteroidota bacterium]
MGINFISRLMMKSLAKQLRKPGGRLGKKVGKKMNESNETLYDFAIETMQLSEGDNILEIGFGNGKFFNKIFSVRNDLKISGLDYSAEMINEARASNQSHIDSGKLTLRYGSSDKIPFPANSFDKVFCINVVYFWEQPGKHLEEIYRVLKPGGKFYSVLRAKETMQQMPFTKFGFNIYTREDWEAIMKNNQFSIDAVKIINEPALKFENKTYQNQSLCYIAAKKM